MTYSLETERRLEREWCVKMVTEGGPGWDSYVIDRAATLAKKDPLLHRDLPKVVREAIEARTAQAVPA